MLVLDLSWNLFGVAPMIGHRTLLFHRGNPGTSAPPILGS
jgi:hypothetical protein